ncbi:MAG: DUF1553 domain-containing protein, partial [Verrucomicrobiales bacterium]|nr:DUF1553 domain-containing protein [Verrucomicrobiales bacterium]
SAVCGPDKLPLAPNVPTAQIVGSPSVVVNVRASIRGWLRLAVLAGGALLAGAESAPVREHWAFQPVADPVPPRRTAAVEGSRTPPDAFLRFAMDESGLTPAPPVGRRALIRRLSFDLRGLPPSPSEVEAFVVDPDPSAVSRWVDRFLASPQYGERWGRWWLDLARYADTNGQDENKVMANAWRYRDWVIRSFNANQPFDQFITDQLAGDLLPTNGVPEEEVFDRWIATGFLVLGPKMLAEQDKPKLVMDLVDEQIDVVTRAFLGLTVGCARCHDHKFDPIPTRDYYALAGIFKSTRAMENLDFVSKFNERPVSTQAQRAAAAAHAAALSERTAAVTRARAAGDAGLKARWRDDVAALLSAGCVPPVGTNGPPHRIRLAAHCSARPDTNTVSRSLQAWMGHPISEIAADLAALETEPDPGPEPRIGPGRVGGAFIATGTNFLELPHALSLDPPQITLEAWVRAESFPGGGDARRWLVNKNGSEWTDGHYALVVDRDRPGAYLNIGGGKENVFSLWSDGPRLQTNHWQHLAMTYDGKLLRLWVDGKLAGELGVGRPRVPGTGGLAVGRRQDGYVHFRGRLDEIRVWDRALESEVLATHASHPEAPVGDGVVARWEFNGLDVAQREVVARAELHEALYGGEGILVTPGDARAWYSAEHRESLERAERERDALAAAAPPGPANALSVMDDAPVDLPVFGRGNHLNPGKESVPRGYLRVVDRGTSSAPAPDRSGRLELARWLTSPEHPLTSRVVVNRVWQAHFGEGLVRTSDNFGIRGEPPTNPALLDWLAREFVRSGWDLKRLHRRIVTSAVYQQDSATAEADAASLRDPENRWLSHFPRQRLEAEMIRDGLLAVSGRLDLAMGGSLVSWKNNEYVPADEVSDSCVRRSVYLPVVRDRVYDVFTLFDFANPSVGTARRTPTVVSHQALFFLNSPLVRDCARSLAESVVADSETDSERVQDLYRRLFSRPATGNDVDRALRFLKSAGPWVRPDSSADSWATLCQALMSANEFLYRE